VTPTGAATVIGQLSWIVTAKTTTTCTVTVKALLAITLGAVSIDVIAIP